MDLMGLSQADSARRLNVCHSIVQKLSDQFETKNSVTRGRPRIKIPAQDRFLALLVRRRRNTTVAHHFRSSYRNKNDNICYYRGQTDRQPRILSKMFCCVCPS